VANGTDFSSFGPGIFPKVCEFPAQNVEQFEGLLRKQLFDCLGRALLVFDDLWRFVQRREGCPAWSSREVTTAKSTSCRIPRPTQRRLASGPSG